ncbi:hypothetical protein [Sphingomonas japonica]|uniref:Uncharacterized protein n=1 Tax=Sphingomonas japonica TaxID=511662 RepID=A0ABX0U655_9SPHN|nr:hypothetical protein [Sphingomonas japonica]NIJ24817.1 hypothetical protein [Sphingomonas japonica]
MIRKIIAKLFPASPQPDARTKRIMERNTRLQPRRDREAAREAQRLRECRERMERAL